MVFTKYQNVINKSKKLIKQSIKNEKYADAMELIQNCAYLMYEANQEFFSKEIEDFLMTIANQLPLRNKFKTNTNTVIFFDDFGQNTSGLAAIYLEALVQHKKVIYITKNHLRNRIPKIISIVEKNGGICVFLKEKSIIRRTYEICDIIDRYKPEHFFFYSHPYDVAGVTAMNLYKDIVDRILINLTDHAFWIGATAFDKCIEFRQYGATVSLLYRGVSEVQEYLLPFYPYINYEQKFLGFPSGMHLKNRKLLFSGGALYKTFDKEDTYYRLVEQILERYDDIIFWYAGDGDSSKIKTLVERYPDRVFYTLPRPDLFEILKRSYLYISTYPLAGGLMFQYAVYAGKVPITLRKGDISSEILFNQDKLGIEYYSVDSFLKEMDKLLSDDKYLKDKEELLKGSVISKEEFEDELMKIIDSQKTKYKIELKDINVQESQKLYLENLSLRMIAIDISNSKSFYVMRRFPVLYMFGILFKIYKKLRKV